MKMQVKRLNPRAKLPHLWHRLVCRSRFICLPGGTRHHPAGANRFFAHGSGHCSAGGLCWPGFRPQRHGLQRGVGPANKVGVIDADYRGQVQVALYNHGPEAQTVCHGDRVAQLLVVPALSPDMEEVEELDETSRGSGGFGSTGSN